MVTILTLAEHYDCWPDWWAHCRCGHSAKLDALALIDKLGGNCPMVRVRRTVKCAKCVNRRAPGVTVHCVSSGKPKG